MREIRGRPDIHIAGLPVGAFNIPLASFSAEQTFQSNEACGRCFAYVCFLEPPDKAVPETAVHGMMGGLPVIRQAETGILCHGKVQPNIRRQGVAGNRQSVHGKSASPGK
jgi:hypothetical protein